MSVTNTGPTPAVACHIDPVHEGHIARRSIRHGLIALTAMALFYVVVVRAASGSWSHLADQVRQDRYYLAAILVGFGTQVALVSELRHRHRHRGRAAVTVGVGAGASTAGMIACCAHHLAELLPVIGAASAAGFLTDYRIPFMLVGITINAVAVVVVAQRLGYLKRHNHRALT